MPRSLFVNLPVRDLGRSRAFFDALGFAFDAGYSDERAGALVVNDQACVMLLTDAFFSSFTKQPVPTSPGCVLTLSADSRDEVDRLVGAALSSGGSPAGERLQDGPLYGWSFLDPDGHHWEVIHLDVG